MKFSTLLKGSSLACGGTGIMIGGWQFIDTYTNSTIFDHLIKNHNLINPSALNDFGNLPSRKKIDVFLENNIGCFYRYFGKDISDSEIDIPDPSLESYNDTNAISKITSAKKGCAIIQKGQKNKKNNKHFRIEVMLMNDSSAELFYIFLSNSKLDIYKYELTKDDNKNSWEISSSEQKPTKWSNNQEELTFKYRLKDASNDTSVTEITDDSIHDLMFDSSSGEEVKISIESLTYDNNKIKWEMKLEKEWEKRNEYCKNIKDKKEDFSTKEIEKIKEWCYVRR